MHRCPSTLRFAGEHYGRFDVGLHSHTAWEVIYQRTGYVKTRQGSDVFAMSPGMILVHPPGVEHCDYASAHYVLYFLMFDLNETPAWPRVCHDDRHQNIGRVCEEMVREFHGHDGGREQMLALLSAQLDLLLRRACEEQDRTPEQKIVAQAQRIFEERYRESLTMADLAAEIAVSRSTLYAHFTRLRGQTPPEYLQSVRLRHALGLLHHSRMTLETIAEHCGYHSASHLSRHIKAATGTSPGVLRKSAGTHGSEAG